MFAALAPLEPPIVGPSMATILERDKPWYEERLLVFDHRVRVRLDELSRRLGGADWLEGDFIGGNLMMLKVLRRLHGSGLLQEHPNVCAYVARGEARLADQRAFEDQSAVFTATAAGRI